MLYIAIAIHSYYQFVLQQFPYKDVTDGQDNALFNDDYSHGAHLVLRFINRPYFKRTSVPK